MARGTAKKTEEKNYIEFSLSATNHNDFEGRVYKEAHVGDKGAWHALSITINGVTIKGSKLWIPSDESKSVAVLWPRYKDKDGKNQSFVALFKKEDSDDLQEVINNLAGQLGY